jgi:hypothetical protein
MVQMNGDVATKNVFYFKKIKDLVLKYGYQDC